MNNSVDFSLKDFRAIKSATIELNGISVVAGVNGSGKSTMSKLLYYLFEYSNHYESLILKNIKDELEPYWGALRHIELAVTILSEREISLADLADFRYRNLNWEDLLSIRRFSQSLFNAYLNLTSQPNVEHLLKGEINQERILSILKMTLDAKEENDVKKLLDMLLSRIDSLVNKAEKLKIDRPANLLMQSLALDFGENLNKKITLSEYGDIVLGEKIEHTPILHNIKKVAYIDTASILGNFNNGSLSKVLKMKPQRGYKRGINQIIKNEIIMGDIVYDDDILFGGFKYKRNDGREFDLSECATGIKSFAILQLMLKNKFLDEKTLLIIDEPEAHLHPQWVVEYARLITLLYKEIGVKFFITSHSTDMVAALKYIAEKEKCLSSLSFYVANLANNKSGTYTFSSLGHDIEPIFESFNKSYEKLDVYAGKEEVS